MLSDPLLLIVRALNSRKNLFLPYMEINTTVSLKFLKFSERNLNYD